MHSDPSLRTEHLGRLVSQYVRHTSRAREKLKAFKRRFKICLTRTSDLRESEDIEDFYSHLRSLDSLKQQIDRMERRISIMEEIVDESVCTPVAASVPNDGGRECGEQLASRVRLYRESREEGFSVGESLQRVRDFQEEKKEDEEEDSFEVELDRIREMQGSAGVLGESLGLDSHNSWILERRERMKDLERQFFGEALERQFPPLPDSDDEDADELQSLIDEFDPNN